MRIINEFKEKMFKRKLEKLGFDMNDKENTAIAFGFTERVGMSKNHFLKCMEDAIRTKQLQSVCEALSGRKEAGRYLQIKPLVIQCHTCQENFSNKEGVKFAGATINLESLTNIVKHLITCDGVYCDCGTKVFYFDECKKCKRKWDERSVYLKGINKNCLTKKQKEQLKNYKT